MSLEETVNESKSTFDNPILILINESSVTLEMDRSIGMHGCMQRSVAAAKYSQLGLGGCQCQAVASVTHVSLFNERGSSQRPELMES